MLREAHRGRQPAGRSSVDVLKNAPRRPRTHRTSALDELRQADSVAGLCHRAQEDLEVLGEDLMEYGVEIDTPNMVGTMSPDRCRPRV
jgi:hypothetical protein